MATAEPTRADDANPGPGTGPRIPASETERSQADASQEDATKGHTPEGDSPQGDPPGRAKAAVLAVRARMLRHPVLSVTALSGLLHVVWFFTFANSGGDLAAQDAWAEFVGGTPTPRTTSPGTAGCTRCRTAWCRRT